MKGGGFEILSSLILDSGMRVGKSLILKSLFYFSKNLIFLDLFFPRIWISFWIRSSHKE